MKYRVLVVSMVLTLVSGCQSLSGIENSLLGKVESPEKIAGMTYSEIERHGEASFQSGHVDADRRAWAFRGHPESCSRLRFWHFSDRKMPKDRVEQSVSSCESAIQEEKIRLSKWRMAMKAQADDIQAEADARLAAHAEEARENQRIRDEGIQEMKERMADRQNRLETTKAFPMLEHLNKKPIKYRNAHEMNINNVGLVMGCGELGLSPSDVSYDRSGEVVEVLFTGVDSPFGTVPIKFLFIESNEQWLMKQVVFGSESITSPGDLMPFIGGMLDRGKCLG